ncbi:MAG TPA: hypothetical protein VHW70_10535 [Edaphobacter sp.]|jgi:hypothetical protein|nr:hypothetical protein [Edaphobacter sp.]
MYRFLGFICLMLWALDLSGQEPLSRYLRDGARRDHYISIPFQLIDGIAVTFLTLNGHPHQLFLVDTGSTDTLISKEAADIFHIPLILDSHSEFAASGKDVVSGKIAKKVRIDSGRFGIYSGPAPAISLSELTSYFAQPVVGILGFNVIRAHPTVIDFVSGTIGIFMPDAFEPRNSMNRIVLESCLRSPIINAEIQVGSTEYLSANLMIDTGTQVPLELYRPYVGKERLLKQDGLRQLELEGVGGRHLTSHGLAGSLRINNRKIKLTDVYLSQTSGGITDDTNVDGALGIPVLKDSQLVINCNEKYAIINEASN